jgi:hypothetical protein
LIRCTGYGIKDDLEVPDELVSQLTIGSGRIDALKHIKRRKLCCFMGLFRARAFGAGFVSSEMIRQARVLDQPRWSIKSQEEFLKGYLDAGH